MKRLALQAVVAVATLAFVFALWEMRDAVVVLIFSLALSAAAEPLVDAAAARGLPRQLAIAIVYGLGLAVAGLLVYLTLGSILDEARRGVDETSRLLARIRAEWPGGNVLERGIAANVEGLQLSSISEGSTVTSLLAGALGATMSVFQAVADAVIVLILSIYWTANTTSFERLWLSISPVEYRQRAREIWRDVKVGVGDQLRRKLGQTVLAIVALEVGFQAMGLRYATLAGLLSGLVRGIPLGGIHVAVAIALATGLLTSPLMGACAGVYALVVLFALRALGPRLFRRREQSPFVLVITVISLVELYGVAGLIVSPAVAAALEVLGDHFLSLTQCARPALARVDLDERLAAIQETLAARPEPSPELENLAGRLASLIEAADAATRDEPWEEADPLRRRAA